MLILTIAVYIKLVKVYTMAVSFFDTNFDTCPFSFTFQQLYIVILLPSFSLFLSLSKVIKQEKNCLKCYKV